jgi:hypothetical protein
MATTAILVMRHSLSIAQLPRPIPLCQVDGLPPKPADARFLGILSSAFRGVDAAGGGKPRDFCSSMCAGRGLRLACVRDRLAAQAGITDRPAMARERCAWVRWRG